jgi:hypothetical protein
MFGIAVPTRIEGDCWACKTPLVRSKFLFIIQGYHTADDGSIREGSSTSVYLCLDCQSKLPRALPNWSDE